MLIQLAHLDVVGGATGVAAADVVDGRDAEAVLLVLREAGRDGVEEARVRHRVLRRINSFVRRSINHSNSMYT